MTDSGSSSTSQPTILVLELERMARHSSYFGEDYHSLACITADECARLARRGTAQILVIKFDTCFEEAISNCNAWLSDHSTAYIPCVLWGTDFSESQRVTALKSGAHDVFVGEQLSIEALARLENLLNRSPRVRPPLRLLRSGEFELDIDAFRVRVGTQTIRLTARQTEVLQMLMERPATVITIDEIARRVWGKKTVDRGTVRHCLRELGTKLAINDRPNPVRILHKLGYVFDSVSM